MADLTKILLTSSLTVLGGVIVYVAGQVLVRFFIDPLHDYRKAVGEVADVLIYHANVYMNPRPVRLVGSLDEKIRLQLDTTSQVLREKASLLRVRAHALPCYKLFARCKLVASQNSIREASGALIGLSNNLFSDNPAENRKHRDDIVRALGLPFIGDGF